METSRVRSVTSLRPFSATHTWGPHRHATSVFRPATTTTFQSQSPWVSTTRILDIFAGPMGRPYCRFQSKPEPCQQRLLLDAVTNKDQCINVGSIPAKAADGEPINSVWVDTGNSTKKQITEGLVTGTGFADGENARLTRSSNTRSIDGYDLDDVPLWDHLGEAVGGSNPEDNHGIAACGSRHGGGNR